MELKLYIKNTENIVGLSQSDVKEMEEIVSALITSGGLTGVKGGQTIIHFDAEGIFQKVELKYIPWVRRSVKRFDHRS